MGILSWGNLINANSYLENTVAEAAAKMSKISNLQNFFFQSVLSESAQYGQCLPPSNASNPEAAAEFWSGWIGMNSTVPGRPCRPKP